ncbi:MAG: integrase arm-type DNA-binding domain-containing protein [Rhodospirillaceae bacterium]|nr:integrase arm-type DNA-binding domain-containing protein [Rhodospirillaceae bacterium]
MAGSAKGLTARTLKDLPPGMHADGGGLYLQVTPAGARTWIFRYSLKKRRREMGLGSLATFTLTEARSRAGDARKLVADGLDPIDKRDHDREATHRAIPAFHDIALSYIGANRAGWRNAKHGQQWANTLATYAFPTLGNLPVDQIDTRHVLSVLQPIWTEKPETASRVRGRIEVILDSAKAQGHRQGENPARWKGHLDTILPAKGRVARVVHHAAMAYADVPGFWPLLEAQDGIGAKALAFQILTACRPGEVRCAEWSEVDLEASVWTVPGERMKAGNTHRVPLSDAAVAILRRMAAVRQSDLVFPGQKPARPLSDMAVKRVLVRLGLDVTPHGFRSTFRTWAAEQTSTPHEVCEAALAHVPSSQVVAAYQRGDLFERRRHLMDAWARFVITPAGARVVPLLGNGRGHGA